MLRKWVSEGRKLAIFSSGSVEAQRMFFGRVEVSPTSASASASSTSFASKSDTKSFPSGAASNSNDKDRARTADAETDAGMDAGSSSGRTKHDREGHEKDATVGAGSANDREPNVSATATNGNGATNGSGHGGTAKSANQATGSAKYEDVNDLFVANYDTVNVGLKMQASSYVRICVELKVDADRVLFLSDSVQEVRAARDAGLKALVVDRPGNAPLLEDDRAKFRVINTLEEIEFVDLSSSLERRKEAESELESKMDVDVEEPVVSIKPGEAKSKVKRKRGPENAEPANVRRSKRLNRG
jgi:enolase-phosphatase E1